MKSKQEIKQRVTVITPYYKGEKTIFSTIDSVIAAYERVKEELELQYIVVIDSMEDKEEICCSLINRYNNKIQILKNDTNLGVADSRNKASKISNGDYLLFLDQDDNLNEKYFLKTMENMKNAADLIVVNGYICNKVNGKKAPLYYVTPTLGKKTLLRANKINTPGQVLLSKRVIKIHNLFSGCSNENKGADDWAAYINIYIKFPDLKVEYVSEKLFYYNLHGNNYSNDWKELNRSAIDTSKYFMDKVNHKEKGILKERIQILEFENQYLDNPSISFKFKNLFKIVHYYSFHLVYVNRIIGAFHKKLIGFYK